MDQRDLLIFTSRCLGTDGSLAGPGEAPFPQERCPRATPVSQAVPDPLQTRLPSGNHSMLRQSFRGQRQGAKDRTLRWSLGSGIAPGRAMPPLPTHTTNVYWLPATPAPAQTSHPVASHFWVYEVSPRLDRILEITLSKPCLGFEHLQGCSPHSRHHRMLPPRGARREGENRHGTKTSSTVPSDSCSSPHNSPPAAPSRTAHTPAVVSALSPTATSSR